jgi:hypothetical protein
LTEKQYIAVIDWQLVAQCCHRELSCCGELVHRELTFYDGPDKPPIDTYWMKTCGSKDKTKISHIQLPYKDGYRFLSDKEVFLLRLEGQLV